MTVPVTIEARMRNETFHLHRTYEKAREIMEKNWEFVNNDSK